MHPSPRSFRENILRRALASERKLRDPAARPGFPPRAVFPAARRPAWLLAFFLAAGLARPAETVITDPVVVWAMPTEAKSRAHPLRIEGRVSYYDPGFKLCWIERNDVGRYVQLSAHAPAIHTGQYVEIEGTITPSHGLDAADVTVRVVDEHAPVVPLDTRGRINELAAFRDRVATAEGYVDSQLLVDPDHVRLILIIENRPVICWFKPDDPAHVPDWPGAFVRVTGLYSSKIDPTGTDSMIEFWLGRPEDLQPLGRLDNYALFDQPRTPINEIYRVPPGTEVRVQGRIEAHRVGDMMTVRDETGDVEIYSIQQQRLPEGAEVEAVGRVSLASHQWVIDRALYRQARKAAAGPAPGPAAADGVLRTVAQIQALGQPDAARQQPVDLRGMVTWSLPEADFFFLQDVTGGIRVHYDRARIGAIPLSKYLDVKGVTRAGVIAPAVDLRDYTDLGSMGYPRAKPITLEQALTGGEDGEWVELRGFLQDTVSQGDWRWIHVTTPTGEFTGHLQNPVNFVANPGSLIRVHGVCETNTDKAGKITGITLRVPFLHDITIERQAPADFYDLPLQSIQRLNQLGARPNMTRAHLAGVVLQATAGNFVFVQDGNAALQLFTHETAPVAPGDRIEAVGILGREGVRTVLREAVYRRTGTGQPPAPLRLEDPAHLLPGNDSRLVTLRGTLIDKFEQPGWTRLTLQEGSTIFEGYLDRAGGVPALNLPLDSGLELTGIYRIEFDDSGQMQGFHVGLRTPADVTVYQPPRRWTTQRAFGIAGVLGGCVLLGVAWIVALRRRVERQTRELREQYEHQARLELEVQHAARLESLGILAGGIAHDFNNALTGIIGYTSFAMFDRQAMDLVGNHLREIERGAHRARDLTQQLLTFAKGGDPIRTTVPLPALVWEASELVLHGTNVTCNLATPPGLWSVNADKGQISLVLQNLLRNALQAMPRGGEIRVRLHNHEMTATGENVRPPGRYVRLTLIDTGEGISAEHLPRIFEPYFSTRRSGGLGLATVYSIVKKHRGFLDVQSTPGTGTTFRVWLPAAELAAPPAPASVAGKSGTGRPPRVLLMDDEASIRQLGALALQRMQLEATIVADGVSALEEFDRARAAGRPYNLVILDLSVAGGLGGVETIERMRKLDPELLAIVSSGYSDDPVMAKYRAYGFDAMVPKPYHIAEFTRTVERLLEEGRPAP